MAFTKTPTGDTYSSKLIPLADKWDQRKPESKDAYSINVIQEEYKTSDGDKRSFAYKRDGTIHIQWQQTPLPSTPNDDFIYPIVGLHKSVGSAGLVVVSENATTGDSRIFYGNQTSITNTVSISSIVIPPAFTNFNNVIFADFTYDNGDEATFLASQSNIYYRNWTTSTNGTVNTEPTPNNADPVALDGYLFISDSKGNIYNSNLNDPLTWSASNFITAENYGDRLIRIARSGSYIVAFGTDSIEWFYDAANPTGSPLSVYQGATQRVGFKGGFAANGDDLYFVGSTANGVETLYRINALKMEPIVEFTMSRDLREGFLVVPSSGAVLTMNGHNIYVLGDTTGGVITPHPAIVYDLDTKKFVNFGFKNTGVFRVRGSAPFTLNSQLTASFFYIYNDARLYAVSPTTYQDDGTNYPVVIQTANDDFDTRRNKFGARVLVHADQPSADSSITLSWTVDDYKTYSTARTINLNDVYPSTWAIGLFRKIAFKLEYSDNFPMRFESLELDYNTGGA